MLCVSVWEPACSGNNNAHKLGERERERRERGRGRALLPPPCLFFPPPPPPPPKNQPTHPPTLSSASPTPACRSESSAISQSLRGTRPLIRITGVFMRACLRRDDTESGEVSGRIWHTLLWFGKGGVRGCFKKNPRVDREHFSCLFLITSSRHEVLLYFGLTTRLTAEKRHGVKIHYKSTVFIAACELWLTRVIHSIKASATFLYNEFWPAVIFPRKKDKCSKKERKVTVWDP